MNICVISQSWPTSTTIDYIFVEQLCRQFVEKGHQVTVIAPLSITKCLLRNVPIIRYKSIVKWGEHSYTLYRPKYLSFGNHGGWLSKGNEERAIMKVCENEKLHPDIFYGHFWAQMLAVCDYAKRNEIPLTGAVGEEFITIHNRQPLERLKQLREYIKKVICVSTKSKDESIKYGLTDESKCAVIPNAINNKLFYPRDKQEMRKKYGLSESDFIVAYVGQFCERKGTNRLCQALASLGDDTIKAIFIGRGSQIPSYKNIIFVGPVNHDIIPEYLCCADIFALPTENEGCCNAIIEAMACGLPIVSADMSFNWDVLNKNNSIMVDPHNIESIASAIKQLKENVALRESMSANAIMTASGLTLPERADKILDVISSLIK